MTIIEFFDRESSVENIAGALLCSPDKVIFIGDSGKRMRKSIENYKAVTCGRGLDIDFSYRGVGKNNLNSIVSVLEEIIADNSDCVIDLSGGEDLFLVAVGIVFEKYGDKIKLHRFNIINNSIIDCDADGYPCLSSPMELSVDEDVRIYGGRVIYADERPNATYEWNFDSEFKNDVKAMWSVCKKDATLWNSQINVLGKLGNNYLNIDTLRFSLKRDKIKAETEAKKDKFVFVPEIFEALESAGVIRNLETDNNNLKFNYKNEQVLKCLTKAGQLLELVIAVTAMEIRDENNSALYKDVKTGVCIDWDGITRTDSRIEVENEMDVILMKGMIPVFISCKNGFVRSDELYKLSVVSERFGGRFVKKILIASELDKLGVSAEYLRARAKDMGIRIVEDVDKMSDEKLKKVIGSLWQ